MKKILAVSGGIDSMVMLDLFKNDPDVIVAHFNHGTRPSSDSDESFVKESAEKHNLPFFSENGHLGENISEEAARLARYNFLRKIAKQKNGTIHTAHHQDDLIESIAINIFRGTGWRGLTPLSNSEINRPLLNMTKKDILKYAAENNIAFRLDPTNAEENYLRNRLRTAIFRAGLNSEEIINLFEKQLIIRQEIDEILQKILPKNGVYQREWFKNIDDEIALEILRAALLSAGLNSGTARPTLRDFLSAIRTYAPNKKFNLPADHLVLIKKSTFMV